MTLRHGEKADEITEVWMELREELLEVIAEYKQEHYIPFGMVERTPTAIERTRLVLERAGEAAMPIVRAALGW